MALLYATYFDVSGEPTGCAVLSVGGVVAPVKKWKRFESEWCTVLKSYGIEEFHATDFAAKQAPYADWERKRRSEFLRALGEVIRRSVNKLVPASMEMDAWNNVNEEYFLAENYQSPYAMCSHPDPRIGKVGKTKRIKSPVEYIFEDGDEGWNGVTKCAPRKAWFPFGFQKPRRFHFRLPIWLHGRIESRPLTRFANFRKSKQPRHPIGKISSGCSVN